MADLSVTFVCALLTVVFLVAGAPKLVGRKAFRQAVGRFDLVPAWSVGLVAVCIPLLEVMAAVGLISGVTRAGAAVLVALLSLAFAVVLAANLVNGHANVDCGCFGQQGARITWLHVISNLVLAALAGFVALASEAPWSSHVAWSETLLWPGSRQQMLAAVVGAYAALVFLGVRETTGLRGLIHDRFKADAEFGW